MLKLKVLTGIVSIMLQDDVINCYHIMSEKDQSKIPKLLASPNLSPISLMVGFQHSSCTHSISSKRKRLIFDEPDDQNQGLADDKEQPERET